MVLYWYTVRFVRKKFTEKVITNPQPINESPFGVQKEEMYWL